jgi:hypothetical protein
MPAMTNIRIAGHHGEGAALGEPLTRSELMGERNHGQVRVRLNFEEIPNGAHDQAVCS